MPPTKDRFPRWPRNSQSKKEDSMSTEQIEQTDNQTENAHADVEAGTEAQEFNSDLEQLRNERDQLALQLTQAQDRLARLQAEFDNTRKREAKERQDVRDYAAKHGLETEEDVEAMLAAGMAEKSREFAEHGNRVYLPITQ